MTGSTFVVGCAKHRTIADYGPKHNRESGHHSEALLAISINVFPRYSSRSEVTWESLVYRGFSMKHTKQFRSTRWIIIGSITITILLLLLFRKPEPKLQRWQLALCSPSSEVWQFVSVSSVVYCSASRAGVSATQCADRLAGTSVVCMIEPFGSWRIAHDVISLWLNCIRIFVLTWLLSLRAIANHWAVCLRD